MVLLEYGVFIFILSFKATSIGILLEYQGTSIEQMLVEDICWSFALLGRKYLQSKPPGPTK